MISRTNGSSNPTPRPGVARGATELGTIRIEYEKSGVTRRVDLKVKNTTTSLPLQVGPGERSRVSMPGLDVHVVDNVILVNGYEITFSDDDFPSVNKIGSAGAVSAAGGQVPNPVLANPPLPPSSQAPLALPPPPPSTINSNPGILFTPLTLQMGGFPGFGGFGGFGGGGSN